MKYLNKSISPEKLKKMDMSSLVSLCGEIRRFLIKSISKTGGHLASNLGVVELTVAIHYCFKSPVDKIVFDVGHQSYVHKILTGRYDRFKSLRRMDGISGFPKMAESPHDIFDTGHSSTAISAALGLAVSRDLANERYHVVSVVGDGSITGGLAFEGMNNTGHLKTNMLVILNDNQMSISENVGAVSKYLNNFRQTSAYMEAKSDISSILSHVPVIGGKLIDAVSRAKDSVRHLVIPGRIFENLGFRYVGPVDGHDLPTLIKVLETIKKYSGPVLLHVYTTKGKGYSQAEVSPSHFHGVDSFDIETGMPMRTKLWDTYSDVFGKELYRLASENKHIVAVSAAMPLGTGLAQFQAKYPKRLFDVGIAESHAVTFASGMARNGFIPVVAIYSSFLQRAYDQILHDVCIQNLHVVFAIDRAGIVGSDGETHQGMFDIPFLSHIPNMTLMAPRNKSELILMLRFAVDSFDGPIAIRYPRGAASRVFKYINEKIVLGKSELIEPGNKICLISVGTMMDEAAVVTERLRVDGFNPTLINARFVKPIDIDMIKSLKEYEYIYTLEDGARDGSFGNSVARLISDMGISPKVFRGFSFPDKYIPHGSRREIFCKYGMDCDGIYKVIKKDIYE